MVEASTISYSCSYLSIYTSINAFVMAEWLVSHCTELLSASPSLWPLLLSHLFLQSWKPKLSKSHLTTKNTNLPHHELWMYSSAKAFRPSGMFASAILTLPSALFPKYLLKDPFPWRKEQTPCDNTFSTPATMQKRLEKECKYHLFPTLLDNWRSAPFCSNLLQA